MKTPTFSRFTFSLLALAALWTATACAQAPAPPPAPAANHDSEPPRPLSVRGLDNLTAFTRLLGYVRFFHPSDQAAAADWEKLALAGVQIAEKPQSPAELASALEDFFRPVAPTLRVYPTAGSLPELPAALKPPAGTPRPRVVYWEHQGVKLSDAPSIYKSARVHGGEPPREGQVQQTFDAGPAEDRPKSGQRSLLISHARPDPASLPRPEEPLTVDLGGGVSARIPLSLFYQDGKSQDGQGTLPHVPPPPAAAGKPEGWAPSGNDRTTRLADVALAWNVFQHFYPYFDVVQANWQAELWRALTAAALDADDKAFLLTLRRMVAALRDGHGAVYSTAQDTPGQIPLLWSWVEDQLVVTKVAGGAGELKPGDVVLEIDGRAARNVLAEAESLISGATPQWRRWNAVRRLGWGERDEPVRLQARHPDGTTFTASLTRSLPPFGNGSLEESRPEKIAELKPGVFYVDISRIEAADLKAALDRLAGAKGIVFDLRGYPTSDSMAVISHLTGQPVSSARWNVPVITRPDRQGWQWEVSSWSVQPQAPRFKAKAAFLTDGRAISFAETYMAIIESYHLAEIVGAPTAGTNGNINPFTVPGGYRLVWTGMKVLKHDGSRHHGVGIQPTVPISPTLKGIAAGRDEVLEKGIEVVSR